MGKLFDFVVFPLLLPGILLWLLAARLLSLLAPFLVLPMIILGRRLSWACPFIPFIWKQCGWFQGTLLRIGFEATYTMNVCRRFLTLPLRRRTPDFLIVGFAKAGTTSMANHLHRHPAISGIDGLTWHEALSKESHFFSGALGRHSGASSAAIYRSYFPTVLQRWWVERVKRAGKWLCFDACPVNACLDFTADRLAAISPNAKLIFMMRDPVQGAFSAEIMMRNLGVPLSWSWTEDVAAGDTRFAESPDDVRFWNQVATLPPGAALPEDLNQRLYFSPYGLLRCGHYADRIAPFLRHFKRENMMFIDFADFTSNTEGVVREVLQFVGADPSLMPFKALPPGMQGERRGRQMHPSCKRKLQQHFAEPNQRLYALLGRDFGWGSDVVRSAYVTAGGTAALALPGSQKAKDEAAGHQQQGGKEVSIAAVAGGTRAVPLAAMV
ncbi:hypothetical protein D9Q98_006223 [Chlorella vulgaris]|uniref:Sulfotransferase n=2 Tax=Chlorella vulgaris TaxID=3077 RepID=A0A9D4Z1C3_CHLVU|nr:hypothetical protein D9Q98_006223 [Chlorella vulgaris]